jgi:hypothetical protein
MSRKILKVIVVILVCLSINSSAFGWALQVVNSFPSPSVTPRGLAWDGTYLWHCDDGQNKILQLDILGNIISSFTSPGPEPYGLAYDGTNLWVCDNTNDYVYEVTTDGEILSSFPSPGNLYGIGWDGNNLWLTVEGTSLYKMTKAGEILEEYQIGDIARWSDLTFDGVNLWIAHYEDKIAEVSIGGEVLKSFDIDGHPIGIAWDGNFLWYTGESLDMIYQVQVVSGTTTISTSTTTTVEPNTTTTTTMIPVTTTTITTGDWVLMESGTTENLGAVWGSSGKDVFAMGDNGTILHYDGNTWSKMQQNTLSTVDFLDRWGVSSTNVFAVGRYGMFHYDGNLWSKMDSNTALNINGIWGSSENDVFAVGWSSIFHYDGSRWSEMIEFSELEISNNVNAVWGSSATDVFAVTFDGDDGYSPIYQYDGNVWTPMDCGHYYSLNGIWGSSENDVFAVGANRSDVVILHYNGIEWSEVYRPPDQTALRAVWGTSENNVFAVGVNVILHYDGNSWSEIDVGIFHPLEDVWVSSDGDVFAVGSKGLILYHKSAAAPPTTTINPITTTTIPITTTTSIMNLPNLPLPFWGMNKTVWRLGLPIQALGFYMGKVYFCHDDLCMFMVQDVPGFYIDALLVGYFFWIDEWGQFNEFNSGFTVPILGVGWSYGNWHTGLMEKTRDNWMPGQIWYETDYEDLP